MRPTGRWMLVGVAVVLAAGCVDPAARRRMVGNSDVAYEHYQRALRRVEAQDIDHAIVEARLARDRDPTAALYHRTYANLLAQRGFLGELPEAEAEYRQAIAIDPHDDASWEGLVQVVRAQRQPERLPAVLRERVNLDPLDPRWHLNLGMAYAELNEWIGAERAFRAASNLAEGAMAAYAHARLGLVYEALENPLAAIREYEESLKLNPHQPEVQKILERLKAAPGPATTPAP